MENRSQIKIDWLTAGLWLLISLIGWIMIKSAAFDPEFPSLFSQNKVYGKQFMWICVSLVLGAVIMLLDSAVFKRSGIFVYGGTLILLILVLIVGKKVGGARAWFGIGAFGIQPSEFSKIGISLLLASLLSDVKEPLKRLDYRLLLLGVIILPALLIMQQPDTGTVILFFAFILVLYREGLSGTPLIIGVLGLILAVVSIIAIESDVELFGLKENVGILLISFVVVLIGVISILLIRRFSVPRNQKRMISWVAISVVLAVGYILSIDYVFNNVFKDYQADRIRILLQLEVEGSDADYNIRNSKAAFGNGDLLGRGYNSGEITRSRFVPEQKTDFIFCTVGEEFGFIGSTVLVILYGFFILRLIIMAERQRSTFSRVIGYCLACLLFMHVFINIGMVIGLAPVIGIPLPFMSYGGSSMMAFTILLFIFIKLDSERMIVLR